MHSAQEHTIFGTEDLGLTEQRVSSIGQGPQICTFKSFHSFLAGNLFGFLVSKIVHLTDLLAIIRNACVRNLFKCFNYVVLLCIAPEEN